MAKELVEHYSQKIKWVDGEPVIVATPIIFNKNTDSTLKTLMRATLNLPYQGTNALYKGLTKGEAIVMAVVDQAAEGDKSARADIFDRLMGKPLQKSVSVKGDLEDFLGSVIDAEATPTPTSEADDL